MVSCFDEVTSDTVEEILIEELLVDGKFYSKYTETMTGLVWVKLWYQSEGVDKGDMLWVIIILTGVTSILQWPNDTFSRQVPKSLTSHTAI